MTEKDKKTVSAKTKSDPDIIQYKTASEAAPPAKKDKPKPN